MLSCKYTKRYVAILFNSAVALTILNACSGEPGLSEPKAYYLNGKDQSLITRSNIVLEDATIDFVNGNTVMEFTTTFESLGTQSPIEEEPAGISLSGTSSFIWAHGKDGQNELAYHGSNKAVYELNDMSSGTASEAAASKMTISSSISSYKSKWFAHGVLAFISWGICAPVAISSSILRNFNKHLTKWWFYIHLGCNSVNYFFTFVVFFLALSTIKKEGSSHWYHAHNKMGLAIFLLATFQVAGGLFRPKTKENESKSKLRQYWELGHSISGIMIFLFGVWQMYAGLVLYNSRYENSDFTAVLWFYIIWMGLWTGLLVGGTIYKWVNQKGEESTEKNADNTNIAPQAEREAENEENKEGTDDFTDNEPAGAASEAGKEADATYV